MKKILSTIIILLNAFAAISAQEQTITSERAETNAQSTAQTAQTYTRPTADKRFKRYLNNAFGPYALIGVAANAAVGTISNRPEEWGRSGAGFGRRLASNFGRNAITETTIYGFDEAFKLDSGFYLSDDRRAGARTKNALLSTVTARKPNGKRVVGAPRLIGVYTGNIVAAEVWFPRRYDYKEGLRNGTISLGFNAAFNLFREFVLKK